MFKNIVWDSLGKFSVQIIGFGISVCLTRLLSPSEFGVMGMAMVIVTFAHIFLDLGFNRAIIQQKEVTPIQYSTIFFLNAGIALILTAICFFLAHPLARFYNQPLITPVFKVLSISFLINGLNLVPAALLYKRLQLKLNSILTLICASVSGILGVLMAFNGYGVWSLVVQSLLNSFLILILNFVFARWIPVFSFSIPSIKPLWNYGSRMFAAGMLDNIYARADTFIVGKLFSPGMLGYFTRAGSMDNFVRQFSVNSIMSSLFPYVAKHQDDREYLNEIYLKYLHIVTFISIALSGVLFLIAKHLFTILFTAKWLYSAELFQLIAIAGFIYPVSSLMCNIIAGVGNSAAFLRLEIYKKLIVIPVYIFGFALGLKAYILFSVASGFIVVVINAAFVSKEISVKILKQVQILSIYFGIGAFSVFGSYFINSTFHLQNHFISVITLSLLFLLMYLTPVIFLKLDGYRTLRFKFEDVLLSLKNHRKHNIYG